MQISSDFLKKIDSWTWFPLLICFRFFYYFVPQKLESTRSAIVRPGGMGDLILLTLALKSEGLDFGRFIFFIQRRSEPWAHYLGLKYVVIEDLFSLFKYQGQFKKVYNSEQFFGLSTAFSLFLRSKNGSLVGFSTVRGRKYLQEEKDYDPRGTHETISFRTLFGAKEKPTIEVIPRMSPPSDYDCLSISGLDSLTRNWSTEEWVKAVIATKLGPQIYILNSPAEKEKALEIKKALIPLSLDVTVCEEEFYGQVEILKKARKILAMDGGMVHVASFFGIPSWVIFTSSIDLKWHSLSQDSKTYRRRDLLCQPCALFAQVPPCKNEFKCRDVDEILKQPPQQIQK